MSEEDWGRPTISGIDYVHVPDLAPTPELLDAFKKHRGTWQEYEDGFLDLMARRRVEKAIDPELLEDACLLCSHLRQASPPVLEGPLADHLAGSVEDTRLMRPRTPVDPHEACQLQPELEPPFCLDRAARHRCPAGPCTGALRRRLPTGRPSMADRQGTSPTEVLDALGDT